VRISRGARKSRPFHHQPRHHRPGRWRPDPGHEAVGLGSAIDAHLRLKVRDRGLTESETILGMAEAIAVGATCLDDLEVARSDRVQEELRAFACPSPDRRAVPPALLPGPYRPQINVLVALYASAAKSDETVALARTMLNVRHLSAPPVRTSQGAPTLSIEASSRDPSTAHRNAEALSEALLQRATSGETSIPGIKLIQIDPPVVPAKPAWPRKSVVLAVAAAIGVLLALVGAYVRDAAQPAHRARATRTSRSQPAWPPAEWQSRLRAEEAAPATGPELAEGRMAELATTADAAPVSTNGDLRMSSGHPEDHPEDHPGASHGHARPQPHRHTWRF
jgi:hypothetical protein